MIEAEHPNIVRHQTRMAQRIIRDHVLGDPVPTLTAFTAVMDLPKYQSREPYVAGTGIAD